MIYGRRKHRDRGEIEEGSRREARSAEAEEELRSELAKARATLERTNSQLAELDADNCTLRERVNQGEEEVRKLPSCPFGF